MSSILFVIPSFDNTSPIKVAISLANSLSKKGFNVFIFSIKKGQGGFNLDRNVKVIGFLSLFKEYDYIHSHCLKPNILVSFLSFMNLINSKLITTVHTNITLDLNDKCSYYTNLIFSNIWRRAILKHDLILCLNEENKDVVSRGNCEYQNKIFIVPNGIDRVKVKKIEDKNFISFIEGSDSIILGSACVLRKVKGIDLVLNVLKKHNNLKFLIIGEGPELNKLKKIANDYGIMERVLFLGFKDNPNDYMSYVDIAIFPSISEGFPLSLIEAMSLGIPCITSNISAFNYFFDDEISRFNSTDDLNCLIDDVYQNKEFFSKKVKDKFIKEFTTESVVNKYISIIENEQR